LCGTGRCVPSGLVAGDAIESLESRFVGTVADDFKTFAIAQAKVGIARFGFNVEHTAADEGLAVVGAAGQLRGGEVGLALEGLYTQGDFSQDGVAESIGEGLVGKLQFDAFLGFDAERFFALVDLKGFHSGLHGRECVEGA